MVALIDTVDVFPAHIGPEAKVDIPVKSGEAVKVNELTVSTSKFISNMGFKAFMAK